MQRRRRAVRVLLALALTLLAGIAAPAGPAAAEDVAPAALPGAISGTVRVPAGTDVTSVWVYAYPEHSYSAASGLTRVAADGTYTVAGLAEGRYVVEFVGSGFLAEFWRDTPYYGQATPVVVGSGPVVGIDADLSLGATIRGTVRVDGDCDLTAVRITLWGAAGQAIPDPVVLPDGRWSVTGVPTGAYRIAFDGRYAGLDKVYWDGYRDPLGQSLLSVTAGGTWDGIDMVLHRQAGGCVALRPYVTQVYADLLGRDPDWTGLNGWVESLAWGAPHGAVANAITASDEFRTRLLQETYRTYLGRDGDAAGLRYWLSHLWAGRHIESIQAGFIASDEFYAGSGGTPQGWVGRLYRTVLGREPAPAEVAAWVGRMAGGAGRADVAVGFLYSTEHLSAVVDGYYLHLLGRHLDPAGQADWVSRIQRGHRDEEIIAGIVSSVEYFGRVPRAAA